MTHSKKNKKIRILMAKKSLNQRMLAQICDVNECMLSRELNGHRQSARLRTKIAELLGCTVEDILDVSKRGTAKSKTRTSNEKEV